MDTSSLPREPTGWSRWGLGIGAAALAHALLYVAVLRMEQRPWIEKPARVPLELVSVPPPEPVPPEPVPPEPVPPDTPPEPVPPEPVPPEPVPPDTPPESVPPEPVPETPPPTTEPPATAIPKTDVPPTSERPVVRLPSGAPSVDRVLGLRDDPFGTTLSDLEGALAFRADGPISDTERAQRRALRNLNNDLAAAEVDLGLADDYFRVLGRRIDESWRPAKNELVDGGKVVGRVKMMTDTATNVAAWDEMWSAYIDIASQYARGEPLQLDAKRKQRIRELMRSRKGAFRFSTILEVTLTHAATGELLTIDTHIQSGHPRIDEAARAAISRAVNAMPDKPPDRLARGYPFRSKWRLRATWRMIPPTALLTGAAFDVSRNGMEIDMPFELKLTKNVMLIGYDNKNRVER